MDEATSEQIVMLCTRIGMTMEDHVDAALAIGAVPPAEWSAVLDQLENAIVEIEDLVKAAKAMIT